MVACIAHLRLPVTHPRSTRTTKLIERLFGEERRRLKIAPIGEKPVLKLMFGALWRGLRFTEFELRSSKPCERIWTPSTRPLSPDQTGHLGREFSADPSLDPSARGSGYPPWTTDCDGRARDHHWHSIACCIRRRSSPPRILWRTGCWTLTPATRRLQPGHPNINRHARSGALRFAFSIVADLAR
jgi:hypothetical protein